MDVIEAELILYILEVQAFQRSLNRISAILQVCCDRDFISCFENTLPSSNSVRKFFLRSSLYLRCCNLLISCEAMPSVVMGNILPPTIFFHRSDIMDGVPLTFLHLTLKRLRCRPNIMQGSDYGVSSERIKVLPVLLAIQTLTSTDKFYLVFFFFKILFTSF